MRNRDEKQEDCRRRPKNPKLEARNPKQYRMTKIQNEEISNQAVSNIKTFEFQICFGFRYSDFEFGLRAQPALA